MALSLHNTNNGLVEEIFRELYTTLCYLSLCKINNTKKNIN